MDRQSITGGGTAKGANRIKLDFEFNGVRYRPTVANILTEGNLCRARKQLKDILGRIPDGVFRFAEELPDFRDIADLGYQK